MKKLFIVLLLILLASGVQARQSGSSATLNGQSAGYYLDRTNHTGNMVSGSINTTGVGTFDAVLASRVSGTLLTSQNWSIIDTSINKVNVATQVTGTMPDSNLSTIGTAGKVQGQAINAGTIGGVGSSVGLKTSGPLTSGSVTAESFVGSLESYSIDVVQVSNLGIVDNDTDTFSFFTGMPANYAPRKIVLSWSGKAEKITTGEPALTTGQCVITIAGNNDFASNMNCSFYRQNTGGGDTVNYSLNDTVNLLQVSGGASGAYTLATGAWNSATKTLTLTYQETGTTTANTFVEMTATAYR